MSEEESEVIVWFCTGLVEQINNFQTLSLKDFPAANLEPFLSIDDDYFYHTEHPHRPEVSSERSSALISHPHRIRYPEARILIVP